MRLIDADHTEKVFSELMNLPYDYCGPSDIKISIDAVFSVLGQVPDADPVKHGRWIQAGQPNENSETLYRCSICGYLEVAPLYDTNNYCGNCGARMDSKEE